MRLPSLKPTEVLRAFKRAGFSESRMHGSHLVLKNPLHRMIVLPMHNADIRKGLLFSLIKDAGMTQEEFIRLL